jgi:membrane protease YdiL (CAAX protease family)
MFNGNMSRRNPVVLFVILAYLLLSFPVLLLRFINLPSGPLLVYGSWVPNIAAFLVLGLVLREEGGIKRLLSGWGMWRVGARWYLVAASPLLIAFLTAGVWIVLGGKPTPPRQPLGMLLLGSVVTSLVTGALGEELGWRGFLLPRLQQKHNALTSSLIVGVIWALWHLPLWLLPGYPWETLPFWAFALGAISQSVLHTFVLNNTGGSLLMASIIHFAANLGMNVVGILGLVTSPQELWVIMSILTALLAGAIVAVWGPSRLSRSQAMGHPSPGTVGD